jgi:glycosyltransferase involved in cell wall biosynthesis
MESFSKTCILIPSYNPDQNLVDLINDISKYSWKNIIIVDDGSNTETKYLFDEIKENFEVTVLSHKKNFGKGAALKTGFDYLKSNELNSIGVITVDADGQHLVKDIVEIANSAENEKNGVIFGVRRFDDETPFASIVGNRIISYLLNVMNGIDQEDTQTGLRFIPTNVLKDLLLLPGQRYEYELECLITIRKLGLSIKQVPIETVYIDKNQGSHFRGLIDSSRVLLIFFRYSAISLSSFGIDIVIFALLLSFYESIFFATIIARVISGSYNFLMNKFVVFLSPSITKFSKELLLYLSLWAFLAVISGALVSISNENEMHVTLLLKALVDTSLFFLAFYIQKNIVFNKE